MENELKPCPFCGGKAEFKGFTRLWVQCTQCSVQTQLYVFMDAAEEAWNRRVGDGLMERMVDDGSLDKKRRYTSRVSNDT